ncbi:MAG: DUF3089 domain-containing protein [Chitinophagales bacterium]|nr:DUF3089 domain-containing protein [Bacteroidota bacterium]MBP8917602.1 DUF3089 domain-containing protein [Chitinophagales bacterium]MBP9220451.1 DUF3089 domain-containing protein [Chitinophagales bacterium]MBP9796999.1 DUF3089 domain-containing protein [Chitinophagales bacterium]
MRILNKIFFIFILTAMVSCAAYKPVKVGFIPEKNPSPPDYSNTVYWSALPDKKDSADHVPNNSYVKLIDGQNSALADVFYIYPTQFFSRTEWNADLNDTELNERIDARAVTNQATVFNGSCKVYIPRYRQATYNAYFSLTDPDALKAFELAYEDVKTAFQYYLDHYNNGRPIVIAGHSQGTTHAKWLLRDFFDGKELQKQLVCAYLIGMPVYKNEFTTIAPGDSASQTGCYVSWRSYLEGVEPKKKFVVEDPENIVVHNPISFTQKRGICEANLNAGGLGRDAETIYPAVCCAEIHNDIVWVTRPDVPMKLFIPKNLHVADYNLYWLNMRNNVELRIKTFSSNAQ